MMTFVIFLCTVALIAAMMLYLRTYAKATSGEENAPAKSGAVAIMQDAKPMHSDGGSAAA